MGSTMCKGGSLQEVLQFNQIKLPKPQDKNYTNDYTMLQRLQKLQDIQIKYKIYKILTNHTLGPSMPQVALTPLGLPSLASTHSST